MYGGSSRDPTGYSKMEFVWTDRIITQQNHSGRYLNQGHPEYEILVASIRLLRVDNGLTTSFIANYSETNLDQNFPALFLRSHT